MIVDYSRLSHGSPQSSLNASYHQCNITRYADLIGPTPRGALYKLRLYGPPRLLTISTSVATIHFVRESAISTITLPFSRCVILFAICKYTTYQAHSFTRPALPRRTTASQLLFLIRGVRTDCVCIPSSAFAMTHKKSEDTATCNTVATNLISA